MLTLLDGRLVNGESILFDPVTYHFSVNSEDITNLLTRAQKRSLVPDFDDTTENLRIFNESHPNLPPVGPTSTAENLWYQLTHDPLGAPLDALTSGVNRVLGSSGVQQIAVVAGLVLGAIVVVELLRRSK